MYSSGKNDLLCYGDNSKVVENVIKCYTQWQYQPQEIVNDLQGLCTEDKCRSIFAYLVEHVFYRLDAPGKQYIKSPARLLKDGYGDCKSLTMFISCCLQCVGVPHIIRFVNFDGGTQYTHVYPVAIDENGKELIMDACEKDELGMPIFGYARKYKRKKDFIYK